MFNGSDDALPPTILTMMSRMEMEKERENGGENVWRDNVTFCVFRFDTIEAEAASDKLKVDK